MNKKVIALLLAAALLLSLTACGKKADSGDTPAKPENTAAPTYAYTAAYTVLDRSNSMEPLFYTENGFYATMYELTDAAQARAADEPADDMAADDAGDAGDADGESSVQSSDEALTAEETSVDDGFRLCFVSYGGDVTVLDQYVSMKAPAEHAGHEVSSRLGGLTVNEDGSLLALESVYISWYDGPEDVEKYSEEYWNYYQSEDAYYIRVLDAADGSEISSAKVALDEDSWISVWNAQGDGKGNMLVRSEEGVLALASDGSIAYTLKTEDYIQDFVRVSDGRLGLTWWGERGMQMHVLDTETGKMTSDVYDMPSGAYDLISGDELYDFYYTSGLNLYGYSLETETAEKVLNWLDCDVNGENMNNVHIHADGTITGVMRYYGMEDRPSELITLTRVPYESVPHKESLTLAVQYYDSWSLGPAVIDFNRSNDKYRIDIVDYSEYNTEDDYSAGLTKLTTEILAGNVPDIVALNGLPYTQMANMGLLADLYPFLDAESGIGREDIFENVLDAMEVNGGLYQLCSSFNIQTVVAAKSVVGDRFGWTYQDLYEALATMPEGCDIFNLGATKESIFNECLRMDLDSFIDWNTGVCRFDSQEFFDLLEFANRFPADFDWQKYEYTEDDSDAVRLAQGRQLLLGQTIYDFESLQYPGFYFGSDENVTYIGYPTTDGSYGSALALGSGYAISAKCAAKEAAWEFLYSLLLKDGNGYDRWGLPISKKTFEKELKEAMTPEYEKDWEGNPVLDENGDPVKRSRGGIGFGDGEIHWIYETTPEQKDILMKLIENTTKVYGNNDTVLELITERAAPYFSGQQDAQTVARNIQSAVNLYVNEQR